MTFDSAADDVKTNSRDIAKLSAVEVTGKKTDVVGTPGTDKFVGRNIIDTSVGVIVVGMNTV